jgi:multiple sugar transport system permease protein
MTVAGPVVARAEQAATSDGGLRRRRRSRGRGPALRTGLQAALVVLWCLLPVYWMVAASFRDVATMYSVVPWPEHPTLQNFVEAFDPSNDLAVGIGNSLGLGLLATAIALLVGTTAAYAIARWHFAGRDLVLGAMIGASMLPGASLATPLYGIWADLHWAYSYQAILIPYVGLALPFAMYTLSSSFRELPWELEDAARVDGASRAQAFRTVLLPLAAPAMVTTGLLTFIMTWSEYVLASVLTSDRTRTVTVAIGNFAAQLTGFSVTMAAGVIATLPTVVLVLLFQRRIVSGLTTGGVKG